jgi:hypothetical protein
VQRRYLRAIETLACVRKLAKPSLAHCHVERRKTTNKCGTKQLASLWLHYVLAIDKHAVALVSWSSTYKGKSMERWEVTVFDVRDGVITEA